MKLSLIIVSTLLLIVNIGAPPVVENASKDKKADKEDKRDASDEVLNNLEYGRYLKEVVEILENDPDFKKKLEVASVDDIKSGNIAQHLGLVQHHVRTKLDEAKQREMVRLRELVGEKFRRMTDKQKIDIAQGRENEHVNELLPQHLDHKNAETFGQEDLEKLIRHASKDLDEIDRKREREFKEYEMRKEFERREQLSKLNEEERKRQENAHKEAMEKKKHHPKVNHPGSVDQMEEVWEDVDHLEREQFSPKAFFQLHDINGDGFLDEGEVEAIMLKEAEKIHDNTGEDDPIEKQEEMDRMRAHVMSEFDKDENRMISYEEFSRGINGTDARNDLGWQSIEDHTVFSDHEFEEFAEELKHPEGTTTVATSPITPSTVSSSTAVPAAHIPRVQPGNEQHH